MSQPASSRPAQRERHAPRGSTVSTGSRGSTSGGGEHLVTKPLPPPPPLAQSVLADLGGGHLPPGVASGRSSSTDVDLEHDLESPLNISLPPDFRFRSPHRSPHRSPRHSTGSDIPSIHTSDAEPPLSASSPITAATNSSSDEDEDSRLQRERPATTTPMSRSPSGTSTTTVTAAASRDTIPLDDPTLAPPMHRRLRSPTSGLDSDASSVDSNGNRTQRADSGVDLDEAASAVRRRKKKVLDDNDQAELERRRRRLSLGGLGRSMPNLLLNHDLASLTDDSNKPPERGGNISRAKSHTLRASYRASRRASGTPVQTFSPLRHMSPTRSSAYSSGISRSSSMQASPERKKKK